MFSTKHHFIWPILFTTAFALILIVSIALPVTAQDDATPTPSEESSPRPNRNDPAVYYGDPAINEGDAEWMVSSPTFESFYPNGFEFTIEASSSAGDIEFSSIIWSFAPRHRATRSADFDSTSGVFTAGFTGINEASVPPWVAVNFQWQFTDVEGNTYTTEWIVGNEYSPLTDNWARYESEDIIVFVENSLPEELGQLTMDAMAAQRETYRIAWGELLLNKPRAILFPTNDVWTEWQRGEVNPRVLGTLDSDADAVVQRLASTDEQDVVDMAYGTVLHEVAHLYQQQNVALSVDWFNEGNATFFELSQQSDYEQLVRNMAVNGTLPPLLQSTGPSIRGNNARDGYNIGYTFFRWLTLTYGLEAHHDLMQGMRLGLPRNDALERVTGLPPSEIERQWRLWLGATGEVPTTVPIPTRPAFATPTPFSFGGN